jgi:hypothetical protein
MLELFLNSSVMGDVKEASGGRATDNTQAPATGMETKGTAGKARLAIHVRRGD